MKKLVLLDFDGTVTTRDTFMLFLRHGTFAARFFLGSLLLGPVYLLYFIGLLKAETAKRTIFNFFYKGRTQKELNELGSSFDTTLREKKIIRDKFLELFKEWKKEDTTVVLVSASLDVWLNPFCEEFGLELICTELSFENGIYSGEWKTPNCQGTEKKRRIMQKYNLSAYSQIVAYGDSAGDLEMMSLAGEKVWM